MPHLVAAPDKFKGTATAREVAEAACEAAAGAGWTAVAVPMADGGEGLLDALGGRSRTEVVDGPDGRPVQAEWRWLDSPQGGVPTAVVEMAKASGIVLAGGPEANDPVAATTRGTGQLIAAAVAAGARRVIIGLGGSATTDGGLGAVEALEGRSRLAGVELVVASDVDTLFLDAARVFAPQKGASPAEVELLSRRLQRLAQVYRERFGAEVTSLPGAGAAGGLGGGLAAIGARLVPGFEMVAEAQGLAEHIAGADLVVTGEGLLDEQSFNGKVVGGVAAMAAEAGVPVVAVVGDCEGDVDRGIEVVSLVATMGTEAAMAEPLRGVREALGELIARRSGPRGG